MGDEKNYDDLLFPILVNEGQITGFLDAVFEFLSRRTDFFRIQQTSDTLGLPPGAAEELVNKFFCKYYYKAQSEATSLDEELPLVDDAVVEVPPADNEVLVETSPLDNDVVLESPSGSDKIEDDQESERISQSDPACYNGAVYDNYSWAQSIKDLDVQVNVPNGIVSGKQVRVTLAQTSIRADVFMENEWRVLIDGKLRWPINTEESFWTLVPHKHIHVSLEKTKDRWWDAFLDSEPHIDVRKIDATQPYEDLDEESQAKIRELMYNEQQKILGKPTAEQEKMVNILKDAWDAEGSPFRGRPFDPSIAAGISTDGSFSSLPPN